METGEFYEQPKDLLTEFIQMYPGLTRENRDKLLREKQYPAILTELEFIMDLRNRGDEESRNNAQLLMETLVYDLKDIKE